MLPSQYDILGVLFWALLYAYYSGRHDVPAVNSFTKYGSNPSEQSKFHSANWKMKLIVCIALACAPDASVSLREWHFWGAFVVAGVTVWIVFDAVVARQRQNKQVWYYLSTGNQVDRILLHIFGPRAGIYKTFICVAVVITAVVLWFAVK